MFIINKKLSASLLIILIMTASRVSADDSFLNETGIPSPLKNSDDQIQIYQLQRSIHNIYELYKNSVVFITTEKTILLRQQNPYMLDPFFRDFFGYNKRVRTRRTKKLRGQGTGFIISSDGYICTNYHVIAKFDSVTVKINDKEYHANVVGADRLTDIALLKINSPVKLTPVHFGNSDEVKIGDFVVAIGNPFGLDKTYTFGIVSATGRKQLDRLGNSHIQTDASINRGNSGGPLINIYGEVIGVNRAIVSSRGGNVGIGFAISINTAVNTLVQLKKYGKVKRGFIGVKISHITSDYAKSSGLKKKRGVVISSMKRGGPAFRAGLRVKDIILSIDGKEVNNYRDLIRIITRAEIGKKIRVKIRRYSTEKTFMVSVTERP